MKPNDIKKEEHQKARKRVAKISAGVVVGILILYLLGILFPIFGVLTGDTLGWGILAFYALIILIIIGGVFAALRSRIREIEGGEEDEASKY